MQSVKLDGILCFALPYEASGMGGRKTFVASG